MKGPVYRCYAASIHNSLYLNIASGMDAQKMDDFFLKIMLIYIIKIANIF